MRFLTLDLRAYGPFTGDSIEFPAEGGGLHLIYGPNEAGKSTALRAVRGLLFGIPERTSDDFVHDRRNLRIGAVLVNSDGRRLEVVRRKGRRRTLLDPGGAPLPDDCLGPYLGGVAQEVYARAYSLGHQELLEGGEDIAAGRGDVGESLLAAGLGLANLHQVLTKLDEEAAALFTPRGQVPPLNQALKAYQQAIQARREASLRSGDWLRLERDLRDAKTNLAETEAVLQRKTAERSRLERVQKAVPAVARHRAAHAQREALGDVAMLPPSFTERRWAAFREQDDAKRDCETLARDLNKLTEAIKGIELPEAVLRQAGAIEPLHEQLAVHLKAGEDRRGLEAKREQLERGAAAMLDGLPEAVRAGGAPPRLNVAAKTRLARLGNRLAALEARFDAASNTLAQRVKQRDTVAPELESTPEAPDTTALRAVLNRVQALGNLESRIQTERRAAEAETAEAGVQLQQLGLWTDSLDAFESAAVPPLETLARFESELAETQGQLRTFRKRIREIEAECAETSEELAKLERDYRVPAEDELANARARRNALWELVRKRLAGEPEAPDAAAELTGGKPLEEAFAEAMRDADAVADALVANAGRVAQRHELSATLGRQRAMLEAAQAEQRKATAEQQALETGWADAWAPLGVSPLPPREMRSWYHGRENVLQHLARAKAADREARTLEQELAAAIHDLREALLGAGAAERELPARLDLLIGCAQTRIEEAQALANRRASLEQQLREVSEEIEAAEAERGRAARDLESWREEWAEAVASLNLPPGSHPDEVDAILTQLDAYFDRVGQAADLDKRIRDILEDAEEYKARLAAVVEAACVDLSGRPPHIAVHELRRRLEEARALERNRKELVQRRREKQEELERRKDALAAARDALERLCHEADCRTPDDLPAAEQRSAEAARLDETLAALEQELAGLSAGATLERFIEEVEPEDADTLQGRLDRLTEEIGALETQLGENREQIGGLRTALRQMDGRAAALEQAEQAEGHLARIQAFARRYAALKLAARVLRDEIARYRANSEGPLLIRAGEIFAEVTLGAFTALRTDIGGNDQPVLAAERPSGELLHVEALSDGTRDQLYLALRLAALERRQLHNEPLPVVLDDILINFDNERSAATLRVLAGVARHTQVLFFTHHAHLLEIADNALESGAFHVHRLDRLSSGEDGSGRPDRASRRSRRAAHAAADTNGG